METPGEILLGNFSLAAAGTQTGSWLNITGAQAFTLQAALRLGTAGTKVQLYLQTTFDGGTTPVDIACITWTNAGATKLVNVSGLTPKTTEYTPTDGLLTDDTVVDGLLGDQIRVKVVVAGTYGGATLLTATGVWR